MLQHFFGTIGKPPDRVTRQEVFAWAYGVGLSGKQPSSATIGARLACLSMCRSPVDPRLAAVGRRKHPRVGGEPSVVSVYELECLRESTSAANFHWRFPRHPAIARHFEGAGPVRSAWCACPDDVGAARIDDAERAGIGADANVDAEGRSHRCLHDGLPIRSTINRAK